MPRSLRYTVLKFVPDPIRDEAVNLGLMMTANDESWFRAEFLQRFGKVRALAGPAAVAYARALIRDLETHAPMDGAQSRLLVHPERLDEATFESATAGVRSAGRLRATEPLAVVTDDPDGVFEDLYRQLVGETARRRSEAPTVPQDLRVGVEAVRNRDDLKKVFRERALLDWDLPPARLSEEGVEGTVPHRVDFGLYNGQLRSVVHTVSFAGEPRYASYQRAVLAETALDLRSLHREVSFAMLFVPAPEDDEELAHLERATLVFMKNQQIQSVPAPEIDQLADIVRANRH